MTRSLPALLAVAAVVALGGCAAGKPVAGDSAPSARATPVDVGHGSVEEVSEALTTRGMPCVEPRPPADAPSGLEQALECDLQPSGEAVLLVHFFDVPGSEAFEEAEREAGRYGVYPDTWAVRTRTAGTAARLARVLPGRSAATRDG